MNKNFLLICLLFNFLIGKAQCIASFSVGGGHSAAIKEDGTLWTWGSNMRHQLGDGTQTNRNIPTKIGLDMDWKSVACGENFTIAVKNNGTLWYWGEPAFLPLGGLGSIFFTPTQLGTDTDWKNVNAGGSLVITQKNDGTLWSCGYNAHGEAGQGEISTWWPTLTQIGLDNTWSKLSLSELHVLAIKTNGTLWAWGFGTSGQLGDGNNTNASTPIQIGVDNDWKSVSAGRVHSGATKSNGTIWVWGNNGYGALGDNTTINANTPRRVGIAQDWKIIECGNNSTFAVNTNNELYTWGWAGSSQLAIGAYNPGVVLAPVLRSNSFNLQAILSSTVGTHVIAVDDNDSIISWGGNGLGQLGNGTNSIAYTPIGIGCPSAFLNVESNNYKDPIQLYPNPIENYLYIANSSNQSIQDISIYDVAGKNIYFHFGLESIIDLSKFKSGLYFLRCRTHSKSYTYKFVKK